MLRKLKQSEKITDLDIHNYDIIIKNGIILQMMQKFIHGLLRSDTILISSKNCNQNTRTVNTQITEKDIPFISHQKKPVTASTAGMKTISLPGTAQPMRDHHHSTKEKLLHFELLVYPIGLFVDNSLAQRPAFLYKRAEVSFVLQMYLCFAITYKTQLQFPAIPE